MLPILVLLVASSALAAPGITNIRTVSSNDISFADNSLVGRALAILDGGDINPNELTISAILGDLARSGGKQALSNGQTLAYLGEISTGRPGDACAAANYVDAYTRYVQSGNSAGAVREALRNYIQVIIANIDNIVGRVTNKESVKFKSGPRGGCPGEGRSYQFDAAWDIILGQNQDRLIDEEYCVAKRMYCSISAESNNVGAQITASALPPTSQVFDLAGKAIADFLSSLGVKSNVAQTGENAKQALSAAVGRVTL